MTKPIDEESNTVRIATIVAVTLFQQGIHSPYLGSQAQDSVVLSTKSPVERPFTMTSSETVSPREVESLERRIESMDRKMDNVNNTLIGISRTLGNIEGKLDGMASKWWVYGTFIAVAISIAGLVLLGIKLFVFPS